MPLDSHWTEGALVELIHVPYYEGIQILSDPVTPGQVGQIVEMLPDARAKVYFKNGGVAYVNRKACILLGTPLLHTFEERLQSLEQRLTALENTCKS